MPTENKIQSFVHRLEEGGWARWIRLGAFLAAMAALTYLYVFGDAGFRGLVHPRVFEQAGISREIARGQGFSTLIIRPAALYQFRDYNVPFSIDRFPDTYHAPAWPLILAPFMRMMKDSWEMTTKDVLYHPDRMIALVALSFFYLSVIVNYFIARRLFDHRLAVISVGLLIVCNHLWEFSMSGLPQMLMLFLFSCALYALLRAVEITEHARALEEADPQEEGGSALEASPSAHAPVKPSAVQPEPEPAARGVFSLRSPLPWLAGAAALFGLMALTHAITIWIFVGALVFCGIYFRPRGLYVPVMLAIFLLLYSPWLYRTYRVCGTPFGVAWYSGLMSVRGTEQSIMRAMDPPLAGVKPSMFRRKAFNQLDLQLSNFYGYMGGVVAAPFFFIALLHLFKRRPTAVFRWLILLCWLSGTVGMSIFGLDFETLKANDLHVLFIPAFTFYGIAFILVLWSRLDIRVPIARVGFMMMIFAISGRTFFVGLLDLIGASPSRVQWPPYVPPYIAIMANWTKDTEVIMSDMPWAVAWYADRRSLWLPVAINDFVTLNDWDVLQGRIVGLYLTPISGNSPFISEVVKGEYKEWAPFIMRNANLRNFPLKAITPLPLDNECVFYADRDRWTLRED